MFSINEMLYPNYTTGVCIYFEFAVGTVGNAGIWNLVMPLLPLSNGVQSAKFDVK